jgi:hypothetical protein
VDESITGKGQVLEVDASGRVTSCHLLNHFVGLVGLYGVGISCDGNGGTNETGVIIFNTNMVVLYSLIDCIGI